MRGERGAPSPPTGDRRALIIDKENFAHPVARFVWLRSTPAMPTAPRPAAWTPRATCAAAAQVFGCCPEEVFPPRRRHRRPASAEKLSPPCRPGRAAWTESDHFLEAAHAILTTTRGEDRIRTLRDNRRGWRGAGDPHRRLVRVRHDSPATGAHATMLVYILTDRRSSRPASTCIFAGHRVSFNRISVDAIRRPTTRCYCWRRGQRSFDRPGNPAFQSALTQVCTSLARQIVADGEASPCGGTAHHRNSL